MELKDLTMMSVEDLAKSFNISKAAVYKSVKKNRELDKPIIKKDGQTFISNEGVDYLKQLYPVITESQTNSEEILAEVCLDKETSHNTISLDVTDELLKTDIDIYECEDDTDVVRNFIQSADEKKDEYFNETTIEDIIKSKEASGVCSQNITQNLINLISKDTQENTLSSKTDTEINDNISEKDLVYEPYEVEKVVKLISDDYNDSDIKYNEVDKNIAINTTTEIPDISSSTESKVESTINDNSNPLTSEMVGLLKSYVEFLQNECNVKNHQLNTKDDVIKNMQNLLEKEQETVASQINLEERCKDIDSKLMNLRNELTERQENNKEGFFKRLFKKFK